MCRRKETTAIQVERGDKLANRPGGVPFLSSMIDAKEDHMVITCDIPSAFMQVNIDE